MGLNRKLQETGKGQYTLTMPKQIVELLGWKPQDNIEFNLQGDKLLITKCKTKKA